MTPTDIEGRATPRRYEGADIGAVGVRELGRRRTGRVRARSPAAVTATASAVRAAVVLDVGRCGRQRVCNEGAVPLVIVEGWRVRPQAAATPSATAVREAREESRGRARPPALTPLTKTSGGAMWRVPASDSVQVGSRALGRVMPTRGHKQPQGLLYCEIGEGSLPPGRREAAQESCTVGCVALPVRGVSLSLKSALGGAHFWKCGARGLSLTKLGRRRAGL